MQAPLWEAAPPALQHGAAPGQLSAMPRLPRCHAGFLARARAIPIVHLYDEARRRRRRLVLCGHSLGGAVAAVSAVRLLLALRALPGEGAAGARGGTAADDALPLVRARMPVPVRFWRACD
jgi:pimeloyl-ACP methyl ester carboxylesterase